MGGDQPNHQNFPQKSSILYKLYFPLPQRKWEGSDEILASSNSNNWWAADLCSFACCMHLRICKSAIHFYYYHTGWNLWDFFNDEVSYFPCVALNYSTGSTNQHLSAIINLLTWFETSGKELIKMLSLAFEVELLTELQESRPPYIYLEHSQSACGYVLLLI